MEQHSGHEDFRTGIETDKHQRTLLSPILISGRSFITSQIVPNHLFATQLSYLILSLIQPLPTWFRRQFTAYPPTCLFVVHKHFPHFSRTPLFVPFNSVKAHSQHSSKRNAT
ncbi:hypothetical protein BLNAU_11757 [Blattamonas nauphoetae]|uniref:Uncharacterized protein n=1 Tax=Blattamonas nauphoetae TaxID=2049346 RepID=A0ABQ9XP40_9EUKA|nr:hypothetical protein BLNAU_11757 [Blattamonas nauphoetae]